MSMFLKLRMFVNFKGIYSIRYFYIEHLRCIIEALLLQQFLFSLSMCNFPPWIINNRRLFFVFCSVKLNNSKKIPFFFCPVCAFSPLPTSWLLVASQLERPKSGVSSCPLLVYVTCHTLAAAVTRRLRLSARALKLQASPAQVNIAKCFSFFVCFFFF